MRTAFHSLQYNFILVSTLLMIKSVRAYLNKGKRHVKEERFFLTPPGPILQQNLMVFPEKMNIQDSMDNCRGFGGTLAFTETEEDYKNVSSELTCR